MTVSVYVDRKNTIITYEGPHRLFLTHTDAVKEQRHTSFKERLLTGSGETDAVRHDNMQSFLS